MSITAASARRCRASEQNAQARAQARPAKVATATARTNMVERTYRDARAQPTSASAATASGWRSIGQRLKQAGGK